MSVRTVKLSLSAKLRVVVLVTAGLSVFGVRPVSADDNGWMYRRSYFSHVLPPAVQARYPIPVSRSAYRLPLVDVYPGISVQGVQRYDTILMDHGNDVTIYRQFWIQVKQ